MTLNKFSLFFILLLTGIRISNAQTFTVDTLLKSGSINNRINMVFLGDGYTATQQAKFTSDVSVLVDSVFNAFPFKQYKSFFNVYAIHVISADSGAIHPHDAPDCPALTVQPIANPNNYFGSTFDYAGIHRFLMPTNTTAIDNVLQANLPQYTITTMVVNTPYYGGAQEGSIAVCSSSDPTSAQVLLHELGHSLAGLGDEYSYGGCNGIEEWNATAVTVPSQVRWKAWFPGGTPDNTCTNVGLYLGANYCTTGWYRPECNCKMKALGQPYCPICTERFMYAFSYFVDLIDSYTPSSSSSVNLSSGQSQNFTAALVAPSPTSLHVTWQLDNTTVATNVSNYLVVANSLSNGTHTLVLTVIDSTYHSRTTMPSYSTTWTINKSGAATTTLAPFNPVCLNTAAFTLTGGNPAGGVYTGTGVSGNIFTPTTSGVGTFTITYTYNGVGASQTLTVNSLPTVTGSPSSTNICSGTSATLTASGATSYTWSPALGLNTTAGSQVNASPSTNQAYIVTGTSNGCTNSQTVFVYVNAPPNVTASSNTAICTGSNTTLTAGGATTYTWAPSTGLNLTTGASVIATPATNTTYTVSGTSNNCSETQTIAVTVNTIPVVNIAGNTAICGGSNTTLTASGATTYNWTPATALNVTSGASVTANPASAITYTVTGTSNGCSATKTAAITVNSSISLTVSPNTSICSGSNAILTVSGANTYTWTPSTGLNNTTGTSVTASPAVSTTYTVTGTTGACNNSQTVAITVNASPTLTLSSNATLCAGNNATLTASGATTYSWLPVTYLNATSGATVISTPANTTTYTVTGTANGCSAAKTVTITVNALPLVTVSPNTTVCAGNNTTLTASGATTYAWLPSTGLSVTSGTSVSASPASAITYTVTGTSNGCTNSNTVSVAVNALPVVTVSPNTSVCSGTGTNLTASGATTYSWLPAAGLSATSGTSLTATPVNSTTYTVTGNANGCQASKTVTVSVTALPNLTLSANTSVCAGNNTSLTAGGASTYTWLPASYLNITTGTTVICTPVSAITYTVTGTANGCSASKTVDVTVNALPTVTASNNTSICAGNHATLTASGATTYAWLPSTGLNVTSGTSVSASPAASTTYTVTGTSNGCTNSKIVSVAVNAVPVVTTSPNTSICDGNSATLTASGANTYSWAPNIALSVTTGSSVNANPVINITYTVTGASNGCSASKTVSVSVNTLPAITLSPSTTVCGGAAATLTAGGFANYTWGPSAGLSVTTGSNVTANPASTTTYTVTGTSTCGTTSATTVVSINEIPRITATAGSGAFTTQFTANWNTVAGVSNYYLDVSTRNNFSSFSTGYNNLNVGNVTSYTVTGLNMGITYYYRVRANNACGAGANSNTITISTTTCPPIGGGTVTPSSGIICAGTTQLLTLNGASGGTLQWEISSDNITWTNVSSGGNGSTYITLSSDGMSKKYYRCLSRNTCYNASSTTAIIDVSNPSVTVTASGITDQNITLNWSPVGSGNYTISWSGPSTGNLANATPPKTISGLMQGGTYSITVTQTGITGCPASGVLSPVTTLCSPPPIVTATTPSNNQMNVNWTGAAGNYRIFYRPLFTADTYYTKDVTGNTSATITKMGSSILQSSTTYEVYVTTLDCPTSGAVGQAGPKIYVTTPPDLACAAPVIDSVKSTCPIQIEVWMHGSPTNSYQIYFQELTPNIHGVVSYTIKGNYFTVNLGSPGQTYLIAAASKCGVAYSNLTIWPGNITLKPLCGAINNLILSNPTCRGFAASWNTDECLSNNVSHYQIYLRQQGNVNWNSYPVEAPPSPIAPFKIVNTLNKGTIYQVYIRSIYSCDGYNTAGPASQVLTDTTLSAGCRDEDEQVNPDQPSVQQYAQDKREVLSLYPNPNNGEFMLDISRLNNNEDKVRVEVMNMLGQTVMTNLTSISNGQLNEFIRLPETTASGNYFVRVTVGNNVYTSKINISR